MKERRNQLPSVPTRGHGIILLLFFTLTFIAQNVALVNINSKDWWFDLKTEKDRIEMGFYVTRYVATLFMFVLGLKAPGITSVANEDEDLLVQNENDVSDGRNLKLEVKLNQIIFAGKPLNIPQRMEKDENFDAVPLAQKRLCSPTSRHLMFCSSVHRSSHQSLCSTLQQKDRRFTFNSKRFPLGLDSDLRRLQVHARRRYRIHGSFKQSSQLSLDSDSTVHDENN
jgi:Mitochondrial ABC-transporter N-terminal five TM region